MVLAVFRSKTVRRIIPASSVLGQPRCEDFADGRAVNGSCGPDLLDDAHGTLGLALRDNRHDAVPEDCEARTFSRAATQLVKKRHRYLGKLLLGPGASGKTEELGRERVGPGITLLNKIAEFDERTKEMIGRAPGQCGLACDLGERRRAADGSNDFDDVQSPLEGLVGLVRIHLFHRMKQSARYYLIEQNMSRKK